MGLETKLRALGEGARDGLMIAVGLAFTPLTACRQAVEKSFPRSYFARLEAPTEGGLAYATGMGGVGGLVVPAIGVGPYILHAVGITSVPLAIQLSTHIASAIYEGIRYHNRNNSAKAPA